MKLKTAFSLLSSTRCCHHTPSGRQCRFLASNLGSGLCPHHHTEFMEQQNADVSAELFNESEGFQTAQGINHSLCSLYWLLASNRISPRRAAILAYISSLQLRTLPAIDIDRKLGITDPTASPIEGGNSGPVDAEARNSVEPSSTFLAPAATEQGRT